MSQMDILLTLYSIVAGLGISKLVQGVGTMIEARERIRFYWVHGAWLVLTMAAHVVIIFALIRFSKSPHWTVFNSMLVLCMPLLLYLVSDLLVPAVSQEESVDLRAYYYRNRRWFFALMIAVAVIGMAAQVAIERTPDFTAGGPLRLLAIVALVCGLSSERPAVQAAVAIALLAVVVIGAVLESVLLM
jgi:hypothetical protein